MARLRLSYFDPRDNLRIGVFIGALFGLAGGFRGLVGGMMIGVFMALLTVYVHHVAQNCSHCQLLCRMWC